MSKRSFAHGLASVTAISFVGCSAQPMENSPPVADDRTGVHFEFSGSGDVASLEIVIQRVTCDGEPVTPFTSVGRVDIEHDALATSNIFVHLDPGCYDATISPLTAAGAPSSDCESTEIDQLVVLAGTTTEVGGSSQCAGDSRGAADVTVPVEADVTAARFILNRVSCSGESVEPQTFAKTNTLSASEQAFLRGFFLLPPGCYDVRVEPLRAPGAPSDDCEASPNADMIVIDGVTTEVATDFVCQ